MAKCIKPVMQTVESIQVKILIVFFKKNAFLYLFLLTSL